MVLPLFSSDYSIRSVLTVDLPKKNKDGTFSEEIKDTAATSIISIALKHKLPRVFIVEEYMTSYWKCYKNFKEAGVKYTWGLKINVCSDTTQKDEASLSTESKVIIFFKKSDSFYKFVKWATKAFTKNSYYRARLSWDEIQEFWDDNYFEMFIPFYSGFLARNLMNFNHCAQPRFGAIKPKFLIQEQSLPFDKLIKDSTINYCKQNKYETLPAHQIYYYKEEDAEAYQTYLCIQERSTLQKPELKNFASTDFSFESWEKK